MARVRIGRAVQIVWPTVRTFETFLGCKDRMTNLVTREHLGVRLFYSFWGDLMMFDCGRELLRVLESVLTLMSPKTPRSAAQWRRGPR